METFLKQYGQPMVYRVIQPFVEWLAKVGVTPNIVTTIGFLLNVVVAIIFVMGALPPRNPLAYLGWGGVFILLAGLFDMIDGRLARLSRQESVFGALYDSVLDRYSELVMFLGICYYLVAQQYFLGSLFAFLAMIGSIMVSYVRARAEGLQIVCKGGLMQRPERILLLGVSAILCSAIARFWGEFKYTFAGTNIPYFENISIFTTAIVIMAVLTNWTAIQRLLECKAYLENQTNKDSHLPNNGK